MHLKKIILCGFKSFADRVTIHLDRRQISGIVGPNGSGKSNVIDAVRWVMGEQNTKMLRGEKATDIIFAGSERRKPLAMAEVSLVFDNQENSPFCPPEYRHETEVFLTRRLYGDGQREFLINRKPCRLKDIISFFVSTGLGGRSYSMIQQGQVDRILQAKPEEIRGIIEEAAGTMVFKKRRQEAFRRLEQTKGNLTRIDDILGEINKQIEGLTEQVEKAKKWQSLTGQLKEKEITLLTQSVLSLEEKRARIDKQCKEATDEEVVLLGHISKEQKKQQDLQKEFEKKDPEIVAINEEIAQSREQLASHQTSLANIQELLEQGDGQTINLKEELERDKTDLGIVKKQYQEIEKNKKKAEKQQLTLEKDTQHYDREWDAFEEETIVTANRITDLTEEVQSIDKILDANKIRLETITQQYDQYKREKEAFTTKLIELENAHSQALILADSAQLKVVQCQKKTQASQEQKGVLEKKQQALVAKKEALNQDLLNLRAKEVEVKGQLSFLREQLKNETSKHLTSSHLKEKEALNSYLLADIISFSPQAKKLSKETKQTFDLWAHRLVVESSEDLSVLQETIYDKKLKAIPLSLFKSEKNSQEKRVKWQKDHKLESFSQFFKKPKDLSKSQNDFLSSIFYTQEETFDPKVLDTIPEDSVLIGPKGEIFCGPRQGQIGPTKQGGTLAVKEKIDQAVEKLEGYEERSSGVKQKISDVEDDTLAILKEISELDRSIEDLKEDHLDAQAKLQEQKGIVNQKQEKIIQLRQEHASTLEQCEKLETDLADLETNQKSLTQEKKNSRTALTELKEQRDALEERKEELITIREKQKIEKATLETRLETLDQSFQQIEVQYNILSEKKDRRQKELDDLIQRFKDAKENKKILEKQIKEILTVREKLDKVIAKKRSEHSHLSLEMKKIEDKIKSYVVKQNKIRESLAEKKLEQEKISMNLANFKERAREEYQLEIDVTKVEKLPNFQSQNVSRQISSIKVKIEELGPINMMAIDEFNQLEERQTFVTGQKDEIVSSIDLLDLAIEEIEDTSRSKFLITFETLNKEFRELFPILFPRGEAQIIMTEPNNPLESGVEIMVRLPGKSQQNMRLFSGGEKALTAIALIFALLKSKPTPFCFLDEVDAALDETNVTRYNRVLEELSDRFQFIVITHRRRTMEVLDTLYGVTMQEPGVSKVVGIDMNKSLPAHLQKSFKEPASPIRSKAVPPATLN